MPELIATVVRTVNRHGLICPDDRVAIALSGGSDSVALAWLLRDIAPVVGFTLAGFIHVNHRLRGAESDGDEQFCRDLAGRLGVPIEICQQDAAARARADGTSLESAARAVRYECFDEAASTLGANVVATGHTEDDQAETVLLRLLRGAGTRGLSGIRIHRGPYIRPLLETPRADLRLYLLGLGEGWREDSSNSDPVIIRNRIRHELVPVVRHIAPGGIRALARLARLAREDEAYLEGAANEKRAGLVLLGGVDASAFSLLPPVLARRLARQFAAEAAPGVNLSALHLEAVCDLAATDKPVARLDLPGLTVTRQAGRLEFAAAGEVRPGSRPPWPLRPLVVPGVVDIPEAGVTIEARQARSDESLEAANGPRVVVKAGAVATPLQVRNRLPGDRFQPLGAPGTRKLQDVLVDRKVPRQERDSVPIVTDANGEIVWVAGVALAERCRIQSPGDSMLILELRKHR